MGPAKTAERSRLAVSPAELLDLLDDVEQHAAVYLVLRDGSPAAVIVSPAEYAELLAGLGPRAAGEA
jgi:hypothetical protein